MTLDDVYGSENERFPLEQEARLRAAEELDLDWDEIDEDETLPG
jgi:hypothetical protein